MTKGERFFLSLSGVFAFGGLFYFMIAAAFTAVVARGDASGLIPAGLIAVFFLFSSAQHNMLVPTATGIFLGTVIGTLYHPPDIAAVITVMMIMTGSGGVLGVASIIMWLRRIGSKK